MEEGPYGVAENLSKAKNTVVEALMTANILIAKGGKVRLLGRGDFPENWDPTKEKRLTVWAVTHQLLRRLVDQGSEEAAAGLLSKIGAFGEEARDLAYRLHSICERKKWAKEALAYNSLVVAWPELVKLVGQKETSSPTQLDMF
jgi:putative DNA methylase